LENEVGDGHDHVHQHCEWEPPGPAIDQIHRRITEAALIHRVSIGKRQ
jgi:hypothetical protein